jgi:hypothetical protein
VIRMQKTISLAWGFWMKASLIDNKVGFRAGLTEAICQAGSFFKREKKKVVLGKINDPIPFKSAVKSCIINTSTEQLFGYFFHK